MKQLVRWATLAALSFLLPIDSHAEPLGNSIASTQLMEIDLGTGDYSQVEGLTTFGVSGLARAPDGSLFSLSYFEDDLWQIDPLSGEETRIGSLDFDVHVGSGLTFDACGNLWLVTRSSLYSVDPDTASSTLVADFSESPIFALTAVGEELVALVGVGAPSQLARIDPVQGTLELFGDQISLPTFQVGLDFDDTGRLWGTYWMDGPVPGPWVSSIVQYDPSTGDIVDILQIPDAQSGSVIGGNLAIAPPGGSCGASIQEIPMSSSASRVALVIFLSMLGVLLLGRLN